MFKNQIYKKKYQKKNNIYFI